MANIGPDDLTGLVSKNKRRLQEDGFDLDLTYITPCIIAMGFPAADFVKSLYRNRMQDVRRLLESRHAGCYKVYNLCIEDGYGYDASLIGCPVERLPIYDGQPTPLFMVYEVCKDALEWLAAKQGNVVAVHCKAGKGRTGTIICALLLHLMKHRPNLLPASLQPSPGAGPCPTPEDLQRVLDHYDTTRTYNGRGLTIPSQRACVQRYMSTLQLPQEQRQQLLLTPAPVSLYQVRFSGLPRALLSSFTLGVWERPTGCYGYRMVCLASSAGSAASGCFNALGESQVPAAPGSAQQAAQQQAPQPSSTTQVCSASSSRVNHASSNTSSYAHSQALAPATSAGPQATDFTRASGISWPSRWGTTPAPRHQLRPKVNVDLAQKTLSLDFSADPAAIEGDLKVQLFQGRVSIKGPPPYMHRACPLYTWFSTAELSSQSSAQGKAACGVAVVEQQQMSKVSKSLKRRGNRIQLHVHYQPAN